MLHPANVVTFLPVFNDVARQLAQRFHHSRTIDPRFGIFHTTVDAAMRKCLRVSVLATEIDMSDHLFMSYIN